VAEPDLLGPESSTDDRQGSEPSADDVVRTAQAIAALDDEWQRDEIVDLGGGLRWRPDLTKPGDAVLHVHLADRLRGYVLERLKAANAAGLEAHLALPIGALYQEELLLELIGMDAQVHVLGENGAPERVDSVLGAIAGGRNRRPAIAVSVETRKALGEMGWSLCLADGTKSQKGRRLEGLLTFLLSQIADFDIWERNLRTDTEELDIVVVQRATAGRCWTGLGAPFILVECKNWSAKVGQQQVSNLRVKMQGRRGSVRIGLIVGTNGFSGDAFDQELRFASGDLTIVFVGPIELDRWIHADSGDEALEEIISRAMLR
jgi:hypothetical protein